MQAYKIIEGSARALESFEQAVADALEVGYVLGGDLIAHSQSSELKFYQAMVLPEDDFDDEEEDEEADEEEWEEEDV